MKAHKRFLKNIISISKNSVKHFPSGSCLISVQNTAGTIWTQSNLILHKSSLLSLTSSCQTPARLNWILAPNGPQSPLVMKCPGVHYRQNSNDNLLYGGKERKMRLLRHEWGSVTIQGLQLIWALESCFKVLLLDESGQKLMRLRGQTWSCEEEMGLCALCTHSLIHDQWSPVRETFAKVLYLNTVKDTCTLLSIFQFL